MGREPSGRRKAVLGIGSLMRRIRQVLGAAVGSVDVVRGVRSKRRRNAAEA